MNLCYLSARGHGMNEPASEQNGKLPLRSIADTSRLLRRSS
jgi:hypothetical protein